MDTKSATVSVGLRAFRGWLLLFAFGIYMGISGQAHSLSQLFLKSSQEVDISSNIILLLIMQSVLIGYCFVMIAVSLASRVPVSPDKILKWMTRAVVVVLLSVFIQILWIGLSYGFTENALLVGETAKEGAKELLWYVIWSEYFLKSKRVLAYYGANARTRSFK